MSVIKVSARSRTASVAGAIAGVIRESGKAEVQAIGAGAVNQSVKAIAIATGYMAEEDVHVISIPSFTEVLIDGQERTAIRILVEPR
jgi:stage V sporulation protein S